MQTTTIRPATPDDVPALLGLVQELATFERAPDATKGTVDSYRQVLFPDDGDPVAYAKVVERSGEIVACAIWYLTFSTWEGVPGLWLEDIYVQPEHRGSGIGKQLLMELAQLCAEKGYTRMEWVVLNWNTPAIEFYDSLGAKPLNEWITYRLDGSALERAGQASASA